MRPLLFYSLFSAPPDDHKGWPDPQSKFNRWKVHTTVIIVISQIISICCGYSPQNERKLLGFDLVIHREGQICLNVIDGLRLFCPDIFLGVDHVLTAQWRNMVSFRFQIFIYVWMCVQTLILSFSGKRTYRWEEMLTCDLSVSWRDYSRYKFWLTSSMTEVYSFLSCKTNYTFEDNH